MSFPTGRTALAVAILLFVQSAWSSPFFDLESQASDVEHILLAANATETIPWSASRIEPRRGYGLFGRQTDNACWTSTDGSKYYCSANNRCCEIGMTGWCCGTQAACGTVQASACTYPIITRTVTSTLTSYDGIKNTVLVTIPASTRWITETSTKLEVVTVSNIDTVTQMSFVTVRPKAARDASSRVVARTEATPKNIASRSAAVVTKVHDNNPSLSEITAPPRSFAMFDKRQLGVSTQTSIQVTVVTITIKQSTTVTSTIYNAPTSTTTLVVTQTFTSAPNAKVTVFSTSTLTEQIVTVVSNNVVSITGAGPTSAIQTSTGASDRAAGANSSGSSLSTGAKAGIGGGAAAAVLILFLILGIWWRKRRQNSSAVTASHQDDPVAQTPELSAAYTKSPRVVERYSDLIPSYTEQRSSHTSPPLKPAYAAPMHQNGSEYNQNYSPSPPVGQGPFVPPDGQYAYPRPQSPSTSPSIEPHHPALFEAPTVHSPRPRHGVSP